MGAAHEGWLVLPDPDMDLGGEELDRMDDLRRMLFHFHAEEAIVQASRLTLDPNILYDWAAHTTPCGTTGRLPRQSLPGMRGKSGMSHSACCTGS